MDEENKIIDVIQLSPRVMLVRELYEDEDGEIYYETNTLQLDNGQFVTEVKFIDKEFSIERLEEAVQQWKESEGIETD
jgi:hypothetical protein